MKRVITIFAIVIGLTSAISVHAADTKVGGRMYGYWMLNKTDGADNYNNFGLDRAYIDVKSKLTEYTSARATMDLKTLDGYDGYTMILKYGYLDFKPKFGNGWVTFRFGLQPTLYIDNMQDLWHRRYALKVISDNKEMLTSSDLGAGLLFDLSKDKKYGYVQATVWNGGSYSHVKDKNKNKNFNAFIHLNPVPMNEDWKKSTILAQAYVGSQNVAIDSGMSASDVKQNLFEFGGLLAYRNSFDIGADLNFETKGMADTAGTYMDVKSQGLSFFGTFFFQDFVDETSALRNINLFGRVDKYDPNTDVDKDGETMVVGGVECVPAPGVRASISYRNTSYQADNAVKTKTFYFNTLVKF